MTLRVLRRDDFESSQYAFFCALYHTASEMYPALHDFVAGYDRIKVGSIRVFVNAFLSNKDEAVHNMNWERASHSHSIIVFVIQVCF